MPGHMSFVMLLPALILAVLAGVSGPAAAGPELSPRMQKRIAQQGGILLSEGTRLILGYGTGAGINADLLTRAVAHERASLREAERSVLLRADFDGDGAVAAAEEAAHARTLSARQQARLRIAFTRADTDGDGQVSAAEVSAHAVAVAFEQFDAQDAADVLSFMVFDGDGDGWLSLTELRDGIAAAQGPPPAVLHLSGKAL